MFTRKALPPEGQHMGKSGTVAVPIVELPLFRMYLNPGDVIEEGVCDELSRYGIWEPTEAQVIVSEIKDGNIVLDVGANIGYYSLLMACLVSAHGKVFAFEPDPVNFDLLTKNVLVNDLENVLLIQKAVSDRTGALRLYVADENKGDHRIYRSDEDRPSIVIDAVRLEDQFRDHVGPIDFIKMDIQGAEARALAGMIPLLVSNPGIQLITEFWPRGLSRCGSDPKEFLEVLMAHGFKLYQISEETETVAPTSARTLLENYTVENDQYTNLFCTRREWRWEPRDNWISRAAAERRVQRERVRKQRINTATEELKSVIPPGNSFILVDQNEEAIGDLGVTRRRIPFLERDGEYWGKPTDDETAIRELERLRQSKANFIVFAWPAFWWLKHYTEFDQYLRAKYGSVLENERLIVFELVTKAATT